MHGNRRRKKRPNYGVRTVEITKSHTGFGFTISGQAPCILSCIVQGSPADLAGLRPGDYLIAVNGQNVSKSPHDDVVKSVGLSKLLKLQIAENYYSDSSDEEFSTRPKPKYPNRLRHKQQQQTRVEKVVREIQNADLFNDTCATQYEDQSSTLEKDWNDSYLTNDHVPSSSFHTTNMDLPPTPSTSPTRLRPDQIRLVMAEARKTAHGSRTIREEAPLHPLRMRSTPKKMKQRNVTRMVAKHASHQDSEQSRSTDYRNLQNGAAAELSGMLPQQFLSYVKGQFQDLTNHPHLQHPHHSLQYQIHGGDHAMAAKASHFPVMPRYSSVKEKQQQVYQQLAVGGGKPSVVTNRLPSPAPDSYKPITEQDINNILYPTLAELQQKISADNMGDAICKAVVGYLGSIEMPKEPQEASRLTAIRNCIRRLRVEKKVHTLVLMSIYPEQVILTNPHGLTLAEYPAERITFCGVYADDKKFFGLVTIRGVNAELSEGSQEDSEEQTAAVSSSCHVFMVDPNSIQHADHCRKAKNFRIECTPAPNDAAAHCLEFPDSADPILHSIMSLYKNRAGGNSGSWAPGLVDVDAQMSPVHSNTSSNSSNSDSGIGFRDEGNGIYQYHNAERVFVVEFDDNQRNRQQNVQGGPNLRANNAPRPNIDNLRPSIDNLRANMDVSLANNINILPSEGSDCSLTPAYAREASQNQPIISSNHLSGQYGAYNSFNYRSMDSDDRKIHKLRNGGGSHDNRMGDDSNLLSTSEADGHLRVSVSDKRKLFELRSCLADGKLLNPTDSRYSSCDGRMSVTDDRRAARLEDRNMTTDGRSSVTIDLRSWEQLNNSNIMRDCKSPHDGNKLNVRAMRDCKSPHDGNKLNVRAMPDPVTFERNLGLPPESPESPAHIQSMRHSMHKYLQHKQEHLVKVSQRINRRESDTGGVNPLSVRAFSPANSGQDHSRNLFNKLARKPPPAMNLSQKLSPKVFAFPYKPSAPSERSFTRSLEDLRDSSASEGIYSPAPLAMMGAAGLAAPTGFRDVSESDHGLDCFRTAHLSRLMHASEMNLSRCDGPSEVDSTEPQQGAFRAVAPRSRRYADGVCYPSIVPRVGRLSDVGTMGNISYLNDIGLMSRLPADSCDENTETTENTGGPGSSQDVHPPTQDEFSQDSDLEQVDGTDAKKQRGINLKRLPRGRTLNTSESETTTHSNSDINKNITDRAHSPCIPTDQNVGLSRVTSWAASFEKLLQDPAGLHTFAEFLRKEFSHENIYFWTACERYKMIRDENERRDVVRKIFDRHLASGAPDPVNIDAQARTVAQQGLSQPDEFIFAPAQKHIFLLMKFDSYSRFLKSDLYNSCLSRELKGMPLPFPGDDSLDDDLRICFDDQFSKYLKKSKSDADDRRRKSLLPWHRKDRSKSKDRGETEYRRKKYSGTTPSESSSMRSDNADSFTSLNSSDFIPGRRTVSKESISSCEDGFSNGETKQLCRVILPDNSNSVVAIRSHLTVKSVIKQLLDRRRFNFSAFNVYQKGDRVIDLNKSSSVMNGIEVRVEQMVLFSLHLPSRKTVYVKAKPYKLGGEVLKPILTKYGHKLEAMCVIKYSECEPVHLKSPVLQLDGEKCIATFRDESKNDWMNVSHARDRKLDELTNRVFDDVLEGKIKSRFDHLGVLDFDARSTNTDTSSDSSSDMLGNFNRRESLPMERDDLRLSDSSRGKNNSLRRQNADPTSITLQENELYEGLNRAQNSRLDDQRGTEINFELPDFLKCEQTQVGAKLITHDDFLSEEHPEVWGGMDSSADKTVLAAEDFDKTLCEDEQSAAHSPPRKAQYVITAPAQFLTPPPPLPPKPKLGALSRGPPPRPPSRTAPPHPILMDVPLRVSTRQSVDKFSVSFV